MLQRSSRNSGVCHCMLAVELRTVHNYVIHRNLGETRVSRHRRRERERGRERERWDEEHAMPPCIPTHTHTHTHTHKPSHFSAATMGALQHTNAQGQVVKAHSVKKITPQNQAGRWANTQKNKRALRRRKEYLALPSGVRGLEEKNQTGRDRENIWEQRHTNTTVVLSLCMLCRDGKPWRSHWKEKAFPSASESFLQKQTND